MTKESQGTDVSARRRKMLKLGGVATGMAALGGGGWLAWKTWGDARASDAAYITATVQRGDIEDLVSAIGSLQPRNYVDVGAQVSGQLRKIAVEVGSEVREGQLLAEIDAEQSAARVDASRAQLRAQQAQMVERELALSKAERDLQRQKNLMVEEATTAETLQNAETTVRTARAQISSLKAQMEQLQASMRVEEANLKYTRIYAPMDGTVVSITARQGQTLNANQAAPNLLRIADLSHMTVQTQVSEADVARLRIDMPVYFTTLGGQGRRWYGQLKKVEPTPTVTNNVVLYNALFEVPNPGNLMTQMTAQVFFVSAQVKAALLVPMSALTLQRGNADRQERGANSGAATSAATPASTPALAATRPASATAETARGLQANAPSPATQSTPPRGPDGPGFDREAWQNMSEEERQKLRAARRAAREARSAQEPATPTSAAGASGAPQRATTTQRPGHGTNPRPQRRAKVKVFLADGSLQEREVVVGISNRVHAEILSGLNEGDKVVAGVRQPENTRRNTNTPAAGLGPQNLGGGPGGGAAGRAR